LVLGSWFPVQKTIILNPTNNQQPTTNNQQPTTMNHAHCLHHGEDYFRTVDDLMALAFQTDVTRCATFSMGGIGEVITISRRKKWSVGVM